MSSFMGVKLGQTTAVSASEISFKMRLKTVTEIPMEQELLLASSLQHDVGTSGNASTQQENGTC